MTKTIQNSFKFNKTAKMALKIENWQITLCTLINTTREEQLNLKIDIKSITILE